MSLEQALPPRMLPWTAGATDADWDALFEDQLPRVYNFFRYRVGSDADAEDLTSMTFEKAWRARSRYRRDLASFATWLFTIARRVAIDHYRERRVEAELDEAAQVATPARSPEQLATLQSDAARLERLLERLAPRTREVVALKYGADLTNREIARLTGLTESNVGTILFRAIQDLRGAW